MKVSVTSDCTLLEQGLPKKCGIKNSAGDSGNELVDSPGDGCFKALHENAFGNELMISISMSASRRFAPRAGPSSLVAVPSFARASNNFPGFPTPHQGLYAPFDLSGPGGELLADR